MWGNRIHDIILSGWMIFCYCFVTLIHLSKEDFGRKAATYQKHGLPQVRDGCQRNL